MTQTSVTTTVRDAETFKCAPPSATITHILDGFARLGLVVVEESGTLGGHRELSWVRVRCPKLGLEAAGKGVSPTLARASALAELAERYSAGLYFRSLRYRIPMPDATHLPGYDAFCRFEYLPGYQSGAASEVPDSLPLDDLVAPKRLTPSARDALTEHPLCQHWVDGWSLTRKRAVKLPMALIERISGTNGLAAGNTREEAIIQATCEILERYAAVTAILEQPELPDIDPATLPQEPAVTAFLDHCTACGIHWQIKDFSLGRGLPAIGLLLIDPRLEDPENPLKTAYAHQRFRVAASPVPREALIRCLTEESQSRWRVFAADASNPYDILWHRLLQHLPEPEGQVNRLYPLLRSYEYPGDLGFMRPGPQVPFPTAPPSRDCAAEIAHLSDTCAQLGSELIVVDLTHPVLQLPTVRVLAPGLSNILCLLDQEPGLDLARIAAISDDFCVAGQDFYLNDDWLQDPARANALTNALIAQIRQHHSLRLHATGLPRRPLLVLELLAPLLWRHGQLNAFAACCETLALQRPSERTLCEALVTGARCGDRTELQDLLHSDAGRRLFPTLAPGAENPLRGRDDPQVAAELGAAIAGFWR